MDKPDWTTVPEDAQFYSCGHFRKHEKGCEYRWLKKEWCRTQYDPIKFHENEFKDFEMRPTTPERNHPAAACQHNDNLAPPVEWPASDDRIDVIGQNGGDGEHYGPEWIEWDDYCTHECPVPAGHDVEVKLRDGKTERDSEPETWDWYNDPDYVADWNIVAYRDWTAFYEQQQMTEHCWSTTMKQQAVDETLSEREQTYGEFAALAAAVEGVQEIYSSLPGWGKASPAHREAAHMIIQKLARAFNGNPHYSDSWHDIGGYAKLAEKECKQ